MRSKIFVQFSMPWEDVQKHFPASILKLVETRVQRGKELCSAFLPGESGLISTLEKANSVVKGRSVIRLIRETCRAERKDVTRDEVYVLLPAAARDDEVKLRGDPSQYYERRIDCAHCGRFRWNQNRDLELASRSAEELDEVESGEILVSGRLKRAFDNQTLAGVAFRPVKRGHGAWQLGCDAPATVKYPHDNIIEKNFCTVCKSPRIVALEESNGVGLFAPPHDIPRIELSPTLALTKMPGDIARTDIEFGTVGRIPEGAPPVGPEEFTHRTSRPMWVVSGSFCEILFRENVSGFELAPAKIWA